MACLACRLSALPLVCFSAPIPPAPFPSGEGGDSKFILPGATAPGTPALARLRHVQTMPYRCPAAEPGRRWGRGRTTRPAGGVPLTEQGEGGIPVPGGGACPVGRLPTLPLLYFLAPYPPTPFPDGEGGDQSYFMQGASPLASPGLNLYGAGSTFGKQFLSVMPKTFPFNNIIEESP